MVVRQFGAQGVALPAVGTPGRQPAAKREADTPCASSQRYLPLHVGGRIEYEGLPGAAPPGDASPPRSEPAVSACPLTEAPTTIGLSADLQARPPDQRTGMTFPRSLALVPVSLASLAASSAHARRRGGGGSEDPFPWLTDFMLYLFLGMLTIAVVGALWRYFTRPSVADLARERSVRRHARRQEGRGR